MLKPISLSLAAVLGVAAEANGLFMLVSPEGWYFAVPGVTTTGPFNQHFIRDVGLIFLFIGTSFLFGAAKSRFRVLLWPCRRCGCVAMRSSISGRWRSVSPRTPPWRAILPRSHFPR